MSIYPGAQERMPPERHRSELCAYFAVEGQPCLMSVGFSSTPTHIFAQMCHSCKNCKRLKSALFVFPPDELVIMAGTVMLAYYFEYTDTFNVHVQGFFCYDNAYTKPYLGPEEASAIPPALLYAVVAGVPTLLCLFYVQTH
ncbi:phospholipid phosphatase-related protein type 5 isoform X1, partial [Clarias magur]